MSWEIFLGAAVVLTACSPAYPTGDTGSSSKVKQPAAIPYDRGQIVSEYTGPLPVPPDYPWAKCREYRFDIETIGGVHGYAVLDFEDPALQATLARIDRDFNVGDRVRVRPRPVLTLSGDVVIHPGDLEKE